MEGFKFPKIEGLVGSKTDNPLIIQVKHTDSQKIKALKKLLHVRNKSAKWQVEQAKKRLEHWQKFNTSIMDEDNAEKIFKKINDCKKTIEENEPLMEQDFFDEVDSCTLNIPVGFWGLIDKFSDNFNLNQHLKPFFTTGLRDYQIECLQELFKYSRATTRLATGLGKSRIIASLCCATVAAERRACVVVPTEYLVGQMVETIGSYINGVVGYGGQRKSLPLGAPVLVVTAASAAKFITDYHTVIIDEMHHNAASTWVELLTHAEKATNVYGLTATPFRSDGMDLAIHSFTGPVVYQLDARWGIDNGWLKPLKTYMVEASAINKDGNAMIISDSIPATRAYSLLVKNYNTMSTILSHTLSALSKGRRVVVLFKTIEAGEVFKQYCKKNIQFDVAHSGFKKPLLDFIEEKTNILVSNDKLLSEGVDIPSADCLINVIQNYGDTTTYQAVGRVLRKTEKSLPAIVVDIYTKGYAQFKRARESRTEVYNAMTDDLFFVKSQ